MAVPNDHARILRGRILSGQPAEEAVKKFLPRQIKSDPLPARFSSTADYSREALDTRRELLRGEGFATDQLAGNAAEIEPDELSGNIENYVGMARVPVGVVGPLRVNGSAANGDFYVPMATTEGALVASYQRGALVASMAGGVTACCFTESVTRAPCFVFDSIRTAGQFLAWLLPKFDELQSIVSQTTAHGKLLDLRTSIVGKEIYLLFEYTTGDASGQNMVTIATKAICDWIARESPIAPLAWYVDGNMSGDKKATMQAFTYARGKKVVAEAMVPARLVRRFLHTDVQEMFRYWQISAIGAIQSGSIGIQGHYANCLAAMFIACGQDVACVSEASVGVTRLDVTDSGDLYVSVSLPNLICGTVGGGTRMPTARECLEMIGCHGDNHARKLAEICAAMVLVGEISIIGAMAAGDFADAHASYGRSK